MCKIISITLAVIAFYIAFHLIFENEAQAKIYRGNKPMNDTQVNAMKGELYDIIEFREKGGDDPSKFVELMAKIDEIHQSKSKHDILKAKDSTDRTLKLLWDGVADMLNGEGIAEKIPEEERKETLGRL